MNSFEIKIWDLLHKPWKIDTISFKNLKTNKITNLTEKWISWDINLQSLNDSTVIVILENIKCSKEEQCDKCLTNFTKKIKCKDYKARFIIPDEHFEDEEIEDQDTIFTIDPKKELINIEQIILHAIWLEEDIVKKCKKCISEEIDDDENENIEYFESSSNITFS